MEWLIFLGGAALLVVYTVWTIRRHSRLRAERPRRCISCGEVSPVREWRSLSRHRIGKAVEVTAQCPRCREINTYLVDLSISQADSGQ